MFFQVLTASNKRLLYSTDGSSAGTQIISTLVHPRASIAVLNGQLLFEGTDNNNIPGQWISNGTAAGTRKIASLQGAPQPFPTHPTGSRRVYFNSADASGNGKLMVSDGTAIGTRSLMSLLLLPGRFEATREQPILVNGKVVFIAADLAFGLELWVLDPGATASPIDIACTSSAFSPTLVGTDPVLGGAMRLEGTEAPGSIGILLLSTRATPALQLPMGCSSSLAPANLMALSSFGIKNGNWTLPLFIPNQTNLIGLQVVTQAFLPSSSSPLGFALSNGLLLRLGN